MLTDKFIFNNIYTSSMIQQEPSEVPWPGDVHCSAVGGNVCQSLYTPAVSSDARKEVTFL